MKTLKNCLTKETESGRGTKTINLSPYAVVIQSLLNQETDKMNEYLTESDDGFKIYLCEELDIPKCIDQTKIKNAVLIQI